MTQAKQILTAALKITLSGNATFSQDSIRSYLGIPHANWHSGYVNTFAAMRKEACKSSRTAKAFRNVFIKVDHGKYRLSEYGLSFLEKLD